jgi:hypothetical protein
MFKPFLTLAAGLAMATPGLAQTRFLFVDRPATAGNRAVWALDDLSANGAIEEPAELSAFFNAANAASTAAMTTPASIAARASDSLIAVGDAGLRTVFLLKDFNRDGNAQGLGESWPAADASSASGVQFNSPNGLGWDSAGNLYVSNAGATGTQDAIYKLVDLDNDRRYQSAGEITEYVGVPYFGAGNTTAVPAGLALDVSGAVLVGYYKDSASASAGVYRFVDANNSGRADDLGEVTPFLTPANTSGVTVAAGGLTLTLDRARPSAVYFTQLVSGVRQLVRARDLNGNGNAQDAGEAAVVWTTAEAITIIDLLSLPDGRVMITETTNKRILLLTDADNDGLFSDATERTTFYAATTPGSVRQIAAIPRLCQANCDDSTTAPILNVGDFTCFLQRFAAGDLYANCDASTQSPVLNVGDFTCFLQAFAAGCP